MRRPQHTQAGPAPAQVHHPAELRCALLLFLASDAVVWVCPPAAGLDTRALGALRLLQQAKQLLQPALPALAPLVAEAQPPLLLLVCEVGGVPI